MQQSSCGHLFFESGLPDGFIIPGVLPADFILQFKEPIDIHHPLDGCLRVVKLLSLGNRVDQISAYMRPAGGLLCTRYFVVAAVPIAHQISKEPFQEFLRIVPSPRRRILVDDDRRFSVFAAAKQSHVGIRLRTPSRFVQYLYRRFIRHRK